MQDLTPKQLVHALDRHIVGQEDAKRAVAVALRNRWRRLRLSPEIGRDVAPKNILMVGPTGVGKTEIARRLAQLVGAPFLKIEATKFTEVGYVGRDVESIIRDLVERAVGIERTEMATQVRVQAEIAAQERVLDQLLPHSDTADDDIDATERRRRTREKLRGQLEAGFLTEKSIEVTIDEPSVSPMLMRVTGIEQMGPEMEQFFERMMPHRSRRQRLPLSRALEVLTQQEIDRRLDQEALTGAALRRCEESGIVFIDEIDKICSPVGGDVTGPDISRGGVQRDLLPLVEGTTVSTRYGPIKTDHILFIAAGAFTQSSPNDLMPEFIGRFPIRARLEELTADDYYRILTEPQNSLIRQQIALMGAEAVNLEFTDEAIREMADAADRANETLENVGARRLYTIVEKVCEDIAFHASDAANKNVTVDLEYVRMRLAGILDDEERAQFEF